MNTKPIPVRGSGSPQASRLISARAGKTSGAAPRNHRGTAHPGVCGENSTIVGMASAKPGSSPRVRGKLAVGQPPLVRLRLIPARARKTGSGTCSMGILTAHPRACGENPAQCARLVMRRGSSPRVRGKPGAVGGRGDAGGLIPARAGKTRHRSRGEHCPQAHPRACGENSNTFSFTVFAAGSSPRVRGKRAGKIDSTPCCGLIPARAGKTPWPAPTRAAAWAHPRACGENHVSVRVVLGYPGSSPRVRGKLPFPIHARSARGLIPARAGKTTWGPGRR